VSFAAITLCVPSQRVFTVISVYFVIDSVRKLLDAASYALETKKYTGSLTRNVESDYIMGGRGANTRVQH
jgi:hypothetical protein